MEHWHHLGLTARGTHRRFRVVRWPFVPPRLAAALADWGRQHRRDFPWRKCQDPFNLLVAEMLLRQTSAGKVAEVYPRLVAAYGTASQMANADPFELTAIVRPLGLAFQRVKALQGMARYLVDHFGGQVPGAPAMLEQIPHVGPYAARALACFGFGMPFAVVDVNVIRVLDRFTGVQTQGPNPHRDRLVWCRAAKSLPASRVSDYNFAVLDLASMVCKPRPDCARCPLLTGCYYGRNKSD